jgi:hypothetical protein
MSSAVGLPSLIAALRKCLDLSAAPYLLIRGEEVIIGTSSAFQYLGLASYESSWPISSLAPRFAREQDFIAFVTALKRTEEQVILNICGCFFFLLVLEARKRNYLSIKLECSILFL